MATDTFYGCYLTCLPCQTTIGAPVILQVVTGLTVSGINFINATLVSASPNAGCNSGFRYGFSYDDAQMLAPTVVLTDDQVVGILCGNSLTAYITANGSLLTVAGGLTATGTNLATALQLTAPISLITVVAAGTAVKLGLTSIPVGGRGIVDNRDAADALLVFPPTASESFNVAAGGASISLAALSVAYITRVSITNYIVTEAPHGA